MLGLYWQMLRMKYMLNVATGRGYTQVKILSLAGGGGAVDYLSYIV